MTTEIDFRKLSLKDALDLAILVEDEAMERYNEFTDQMHDIIEFSDRYANRIGRRQCFQRGRLNVLALSRRFGTGLFPRQGLMLMDG